MEPRETHLNFVQRGTREYEGRVAPTEHQTHLTYELTHGITNNFELAGYLVLAQRPGSGDILEYAGSAYPAAILTSEVMEAAG